MIDSRMAINSLMTATIDDYISDMKGITLANYVEFKDFIKDESGQIIGAKLFDSLQNEEIEVNSKVIVNCTGIHADQMRLKDDESAETRIVGARGTHLMFKKGFLPADSGIIIPKTKDGRLIFVINYLGHPMVGTSDVNCDVTHYCEPS
jgi:glycerol-3-phosphate dehydrogenase